MTSRPTRLRRSRRANAGRTQEYIIFTAVILVAISLIVSSGTNLRDVFAMANATFAGVEGPATGSPSTPSLPSLTPSKPAETGGGDGVNWYIRNSGTGGACTKASPCLIAEAYGNVAFDDGDNIWLTEDVTVGMVSRSEANISIYSDDTGPHRLTTTSLFQFAGTLTLQDLVISSSSGTNVSSTSGNVIVYDSTLVMANSSGTNNLKLLANNGGVRAYNVTIADEATFSQARFDITGRFVDLRTVAMTDASPTSSIHRLTVYSPLVLIDGFTGPAATSSTIWAYGREVGGVGLDGFVFRNISGQRVDIMTDIDLTMPPATPNYDVRLESSNINQIDVRNTNGGVTSATITGNTLGGGDLGFDPIQGRWGASADIDFVITGNTLTPAASTGPIFDQDGTTVAANLCIGGSGNSSTKTNRILDLRLNNPGLLQIENLATISSWLAISTINNTGTAAASNVAGGTCVSRTIASP